MFKLYAIRVYSNVPDASVEGEWYSLDDMFGTIASTEPHMNELYFNKELVQDKVEDLKSFGVRAEMVTFECKEVSAKEE